MFLPNSKATQDLIREVNAQYDKEDSFRELTESDDDS